MIFQAQFCQLPIPTLDGEFLAHYSPNGLCGLDFPERANPVVTEQTSLQPTPQIGRWHATTREALVRALSGKSPQHLPPLDLSAGTDFRQRVWAALRQIGVGQTCSYAEVARAIGRPNAVRAVGGACGANPIPVLVPCHRVLAAHQALGGFSAGLRWKRTLLTREGVGFTE